MYWKKEREERLGRAWTLSREDDKTSSSTKSLEIKDWGMHKHYSLVQQYITSSTIIFFLFANFWAIFITYFLKKLLYIQDVLLQKMPL
jgi:hypothetical protein